MSPGGHEFASGDEVIQIRSSPKSTDSAFMSVIGGTPDNILVRLAARDEAPRARQPSAGANAHYQTVPSIVGHGWHLATR
jgi:hypothetical protein